MAAPDLKTLFQQEEQLNEAIVGVLNDAAPSFYAHDTQARPADHNLVVTELGAATGHEFSNGEWDTFAFRLRVTVVTERDVESPTPAKHALQKGTVRALLSKLSGKFTSVNLPYLQITLLRPDGTTVEFNDDNQRSQDITVLEYAGMVSIRENAWP